MVVGQMDMANGTVLCVYPDGTYKDFPSLSVIPCTLATLVGLASTGTDVSFDNHAFVPRDYPEASTLRDERWITATEYCVDDMETCKVGTWVKLKNVKDSISSRFVYQVKYKAERGWYAFCRWTPRGFEQIPDLHFDPEGIFAGTPQLCILRMILAKALAKRQKTFHFDFKRAFSNTQIDKTVHVRMPKGYKKFDADGDELCLKLDKASEGLKQSGARWLEKLDTHLVKLGFKKCDQEPKLYVKKLENGEQCDIMVYIDDLLGTCGSDEYVKELYKNLNEEFGVECKWENDGGEIVSTLGIAISRDESGIKMSSADKIRELLLRQNMDDCTIRKVPLPCDFDLDEALEDELLDQKEKTDYQSFVGSFLWINRCTRPDISYQTWVLACGMSKPTKALLHAAKHLARYLSYTIDRDLQYSDEQLSDLDLSRYYYKSTVPVAFTDSNWGCPRSVSSSLVMYMNAALLWKVGKQQHTGLSTVETELYALSECAREVLYARHVCEFLNFGVKDDTTIFCDAKGTIENAKHPTLKNKLKHVDSKAFFIREQIERKRVHVRQIAGVDNPSDIGTKNLGSGTHDLFARFILNAESQIEKKRATLEQKKTTSKKVAGLTVTTGSLPTTSGAYYFDAKTKQFFPLAV
jgi:hypothetical protein